MPTYEQKLSMMERGFWLKCAIPSCPNPASRNYVGSCCSDKCFDIVRYANLKDNGKYYRTKRHRKKRAAAHRRWWRTEEGADLRERLVPMMSSMGVREKVAFSRKRTAKEQQAIGRYESPKGTYKEGHLIPYRNEFEEEAFKRIDANPTVVRWSYSELSVPYYQPGQVRKSFLFPDLLIEYSDGRKKVLDLKPDGYTADTLSEFQAMNGWCSEKGILYEVWTLESLAENVVR